LAEVPEDVFYVFESDRNANHIGTDSGRDLLLIAQLLVRGACRVNYQALRVSHIGKVRMQLTDSITFSCLTPFMPNVKIDPGPFWQYFCERSW
jgi:hypothetical protein